MFSRIPRSRLLPVSGWFSLAAGAALFAGLSAAARAADPTPTPSVPPRDWSQNPAIVEFDTPSSQVWAIGDTHGDYARLIDLLVKGGIIDEVSRQPDHLGNVKWKVGNAVLVCTGDMIDKGNQSVEVLQLFMRLRNIAPDAGGKVIVTMGNHEAEFLANPTATNKKAVEFLAQLKRLNIDAAQVGAGTDSLGLGQFMRSLPFAARVNDWFFAHAGNTNSKNPNAWRSLAELRSFLENDVTRSGYGGESLSGDDSLLEARLDDPWWQKGEADDWVLSLRLSVTALGTASHPVKHLVVGHKPGKVDLRGEPTRKKGVMANRYLGLLFLIDCGMSSAVNYSTGALLRIRPDDVYSIRFEGNVRKEELLMGQLAAK